MTRQIYKYLLAAILLATSYSSLAQTVIRTAENYPTGGSFAVEIAASQVVQSWVQNTGNSITSGSEVRIIWNGQVAETYRMVRTMGGWLAQIVPDTKQVVSYSEQSSPIGGNHCSESQEYSEFTLSITTIWYLPSTGEILDSSTRQEVIQTGGGC